MSVTKKISLVLEAFGPQDTSLGIREIARRANLAPSTAHRLIAELVEIGYLERVDNGTLRLGLSLFELGHLVPQQRNLREMALPLMEDLRYATRQTVHLAVRDETEVVYVEILGNQGTDLPSRVGGRMPAYCTGVGKAILAFSDPQVVQAVINQGLLKRTEHTITDANHLLRELAEIRLRGVAFDREESAIGVMCAASPIKSRNLPATSAISVTGKRGMLDLEKVAPAVQTVARVLSRRLPIPLLSSYQRQ